MKMLALGLLLVSSGTFAKTNYTINIKNNCENVCVAPEGDHNDPNRTCLQSWGPIARGWNKTVLESENTFTTFSLSPQTEGLFLRDLIATVYVDEETTQNVNFNVFGVRLRACESIELRFDNPTRIVGFDLLTFGESESMAVVGQNEPEEQPSEDQ